MSILVYRRSSSVLSDAALSLWSPIINIGDANERSAACLDADGNLYVAARKTSTPYNRGLVLKVNRITGELDWVQDLDSALYGSSGSPGSTVASLHAVSGQIVACVEVPQVIDGQVYHRPGLAFLDALSGQIDSALGFHVQKSLGFDFGLNGAHRPVACATSDGGVALLMSLNVYQYEPCCLRLSADRLSVSGSVLAALHYPDHGPCPMVIGNGGEHAALLDTSSGLVALKLAGTALSSGKTFSGFAPTSASVPSGGGLIATGTYSGKPVLLKLTSGLSLAWCKQIGSSGTLLAACETPYGVAFFGQVDGAWILGSLSSAGTLQWAWDLLSLGWAGGGAHLLSGDDGITLVAQNVSSGLILATVPADGGQDACTIFNSEIEPALTSVSLSPSTSSGSSPAPQELSAFEPSLMATASAATVLTETCSVVLVDEEPPIPDPGPGDGGSGGGSGGGGVSGDDTDGSMPETAFLVLHEDGGGWTVWRGLPGRDGLWHSDRTCPVLLGDGRISFLPARGNAFVDSRLIWSFADLGDRQRIKKAHYLTADMTGDGQTGSCTFYIDEAEQPQMSVTLTAQDMLFSEDGSGGTFSSDGTGGVFRQPAPQLVRVWQGSHQRGLLSRLFLRFWSRYEQRIHRIIVNFALRNPPR